MSKTKTVMSKFERMGAQVTIREMTRESFSQHGSPLTIDIRRQPTGEMFDIERTADVTLSVPEVQSRQRHLLLQAATSLSRVNFLCGHDEMHWFVATLPDGNDSRTVAEAKQSLKPDLVKRKERPKGGKRRRKGDAYIRQGEWFFMPWPHVGVNNNKVLRHAGLVRGPGSKPHMCEFMFLDGEREYACDRYPKLAFFESEYKEILKTRRKAKQWNWQQLPFEPVRYVKGWITHPDHNPMFLDVWHRVEMNTEVSTGLQAVRQRPQMAKVLYLD